MKKNDIIAQKLFETCKLSEFYLNLLKHEDESPMQLAHAYKQKLYEIVERYDRLLNANRQREQLNLELIENNNSKLKKPKSISLSRTSTPNKSTSALNTPNSQMPISILTSNSSTNLPPNSHSSSYSSTATSTPASTPGHSNIKSSFGTYTRSSTRSIYSQAKQQHHYSNKQMQRFAYLYTDTTDESDLEDNDEYAGYDYKNSDNTVKRQLEYDNYSTSGNSKKSEANSESDEEEEKCIDGDSNQNIEKSYSNLSKDSGVFGESYHSECSNHIQGIGNTSKQSATVSENEHNETGEDRVSDEDNTFEENLTSPSSSSSSSNHYSRDEPIYRPAQSTPKSINSNAKEPPNDSFIWGTVSRLVEEESSTKGNKIDMYSNSQAITTGRPVKSNFFLNKLNNEQQQSKNLLKSTLTNNYRSGNIDVDNTSMMSMMIDSNNSVSTATSPKSYKISESPTEQKEATAKGSPFIFNYNSLMNVSMLDNIQATNTNNSEVDNMNCSILMFN